MGKHIRGKAFEMKITINEKVISISPYLSTAWDNVRALYVENTELIFLLKDSSKVAVPGLEELDIQRIFEAHADVVGAGHDVVEGTHEKLNETLTHLSDLLKQGESDTDMAIQLPLQLDMAGLESMSAVMQHNPEQSDGPDLPAEVLSKVSAVAGILGQEDGLVIPEPQTNCNCFYCQVARAIQYGLGEEEDLECLDEEVKDEDLNFRLWDIEQKANQLYVVSNPLDKQEQYSVYLGDPLGCTCGQKNCEHIRAVLES